MFCAWYYSSGTHSIKLRLKIRQKSLKWKFYKKYWFSGVKKKNIGYFVCFNLNLTLKLIVFLKKLRQMKNNSRIHLLYYFIQQNRTENFDFWWNL